MKTKNKYDKYLNHDVNFERFKEFVRESKVGTLNPDKNIQQAILGLIGEWGEVADILKKHIFQGHKMDKDHLIEELGDCCWYGMLLIEESKLDTHVIFYKNWRVNSSSYHSMSDIIGLISNGSRCIGELCKILDYYTNHGVALAALDCIRSIFWCIETVGNLYGCTLFDIFANNVKKISIRYPDGFSINNSINR